MLSIRCLMHQPIDVENCEKSMSTIIIHLYNSAKRVYPWVAFDVLKIKGKK